MAKYVFQPNESQVLKTEGVSHGDGLLTNLSHDVVLTTQNLLLMKKGFFGNSKSTLVFPLSALKVYDGKAQVFVEADSTLVVHFQHGQERFQFRTRKLAGQWVEQINLVVVGHAHQAELPESAGEVVWTQFKEVFGIPSSGTSSHATATLAANAAAGDCPSCGAPVSGLRGEVSPCSYCDTAIQF